MKKTILFSAFAIFLLAGCFGDAAEQSWTAMIYPDKSNEKRNKKFAVYNTLEECRKGSLEELKNLGLSTRGDYKCGLNCEYHEGMKVDICEKLAK